MNIYLIGIKGTGMSALACLLADLGHRVRGSDVSRYIFTQEKLKEKDSIQNVIPDTFIPSKYEVIIAIINKFDDIRPKIPFFSKVAICFIARNIENLGYKLKIKNIKMKGDSL